MLQELLAGAAKTIGNVRYCWLMTTAEDGIHARPMGAFRPNRERRR